MGASRRRKHPAAARTLASGAGAVQQDGHMGEQLIWPGAEAAPRDQLDKHGTAWLTQAVCVFERLPVLAPDPPQWELEYDAYQDNIAKLLHQRGIDTDPLIRSVSEMADSDGGADEVDSGEQETMVKKTEEKAEFVTTRTLPADATGDRRTVGRALTERLYLLVKARDVLQKNRVAIAISERHSRSAETLSPLLLNTPTMGVPHFDQFGIWLGCVAAANGPLSGAG